MQVQVPDTNRPQSAVPVCSRFYCDESGQDLIEYALLAALVASGSVASNVSLALSISNSLTGVQGALTNSLTPPATNQGGGGNGGRGGRSGGHGGDDGGHGRH